MIPVTSLHPLRYIGGMAALNLPSSTGTGDWHFVQTFERERQHRSRSFISGAGCLTDTSGLLGDAGRLVELLAEHRHVQIVLSTSWARHLPFEQVRDFLPVSLRRRVVGSTWHRIQTDPEFSRGLQLSYWRDASRYQQVKRWVNIHRLRRWVAIDDDAEGWDSSDRARLVQTDAETGLSDPAVVARLSDLLAGK